MAHEVWFPGNVTSAPDARHWLTDELRAASVGAEALFRAEQVFAEFMSNAIRHSRSGQPGGGVHARLRIGSNLLRLEVTDDGSDAHEPRARRSGNGGETGHGLFLVDAFSSQWWTRTNGEHRTMFAEIAHGPDVPPLSTISAVFPVATESLRAETAQVETVRVDTARVDTARVNTPRIDTVRVGAVLAEPVG